MRSELEKNNVQFDYFSGNYQQFEEDFYRYALTNIPLTFLTDDILRMMNASKISYFRLQSAHAKDEREHYFLFKKKRHVDNERVCHYEYVGHRWNLTEKEKNPSD